MKSFFRTVFLVMMLLSVTNTFAQPTRSTQNRNRGNSMQQLGNSFRNALNQQKQQQRKSTTSSQSRSKNSKSTSSTNNDSSDPLEEEFNKGRSKSDSNRNNAQQAAVQKEKDDVTLVVSGTGKDKTEATKVALRSAIEQAYGVFVSANTDILNDELVKDEVATIASGNIKSYKELSSTNLPDGTVSVSLSAIVSTGKLVSYVQAHGGSAEFAGQTFLMEMKMRELNKKNESEAINHFLSKYYAIQSVLYDCTLEIGEPKTAYLHVKNGQVSKIDSKAYSLPLKLKIMPTDNLINFMIEFENTLKSLCLSDMEYESYRNNDMYVGRIGFAGKTYWMRNSYNFSSLADVLNRWRYHWEIVLNGDEFFVPVVLKDHAKYSDIEFYYASKDPDAMAADVGHSLGDCLLVRGSFSDKNKIERPYLTEFKRHNSAYCFGEYEKITKIWGWGSDSREIVLFDNNKNPLDKWTFTLSFDIGLTEQEISSLQKLEVIWVYPNK